MNGPGAPSRPAGRLPAILGAGALTALVVVQQTLHLGGTSRLSLALNDAMHLPMFVAVTLLLAGLLGRRRLGLALGAAVVLAVATEAVQLLTPRDASLVDLGHDLLGILLAVLGLLGAGPAARCAGGRAGPVLWWAGVGLVTLGLAGADPLRIHLAERARDRAFPVLLTPAAGMPGPLVATRSELGLVAAPPGWPAGAGAPAFEVVWAEETWPGVVMLEVVPDWSDYEALAVDVDVLDGRPITLTANVQYRTEPRRATWLWRTLQPGPQTVRFPLADLVDPDVGAIDRLIVHVTAQDAGRRTLLGAVRLVGPAPGEGR